VPHGVVNDRWGDTHWDYRTSEYQLNLANEAADAWENCRGIGLSFGYNQVEDATHSLDGPGIIRHLADVVSRGGNLLLNVGPTASGEIPALQRRALEQLADWMAVNSAAIHGTRPLSADIAGPSDEPWVRWTRAGDTAYAIVDGAGTLNLSRSVDAASARLADGTPVPAKEGLLEIPSLSLAGPAVVGFSLRQDA
jgi:alpha-L-fucosidase